MSVLEIKKLARIINDDFVIPEESNSWYEELLADQCATNSLIHASLEESISSQYLQFSID